jgi:glyoxylase-like metal-dependent hydrolase (beta-lactamase superfamily II)
MQERLSMTKRFLSFLALGCALGASAAFAQPALEVTNIADGVWAARPPTGGNVGWFLSGDGVVVVDAGATPAIARAVLQKIAETAKKRVTALVLTHSHADHVGGARVFAAAGARVICHENAAPVIGAFLLAAPDSKDPADTKAPGVSVEAFSERLLLFARDRQADLYWLGVAHTNADIVVYLPREKTLFSGDLVANAFIPDMQSKDCDPPGWERALVGLTTLSVEHLVPGHGVLDTPVGIQGTGAYVQKTIRLARALIEGNLPEGAYATKAAEPEYRIEGVPLNEQHLANVKAVVRYEREHPKQAGPGKKAPPEKKD